MKSLARRPTRNTGRGWNGSVVSHKVQARASALTLESDHGRESEVGIPL